MGILGICDFEQMNSYLFIGGMAGSNSKCVLNFAGYFQIALQIRWNNLFSCQPPGRGPTLLTRSGYYKYLNIHQHNNWYTGAPYWLNLIFDLLHTLQIFPPLLSLFFQLHLGCLSPYNHFFHIPNLSVFSLVFWGLYLRKNFTPKL